MTMFLQECDDKTVYIVKNLCSKSTQKYIIIILIIWDYIPRKNQTIVVVK